ncbi:MAG: tRNA (adenosine(37)-N6)-dimethylallyltransferase MiaA [Zetaproteobacteria bacterium]|nr:tRNA (adenosine(37)-N6)-dimethylallyltransferase MiaA [Zetaproteobacteria bacterium]
MKLHQPYISIVGPTASGKSALGLSLAQRLEGTIINGDSVQLYRGFDIGSAKPSLDEQQKIPHRLFDTTDFSNPWDASKYAAVARECIKETLQQGRIPIVVGGSGLYLKALWGDTFDDLPSSQKLRDALDQETTIDLYERLHQMDPTRHAQLNINDRFRIRRAVELCTLLGEPVSTVYNKSTPQGDFFPRWIIFMHPERSVLHQRIHIRCQEMMTSGLIEETQQLLTQGCPVEAAPMKSIGYKQVSTWLQTPAELRSSTKDLGNKIVAATRQYAKRQVTWFKKISYTHKLETNSPTTETIEKIVQEVAHQF